jgi:hypothetical protein
MKKSKIENNIDIYNGTGMKDDGKLPGQNKRIKTNL